MGQRYDTILSYSSELVGMRIKDKVTGESMVPAEVSEFMDEHRWVGGWRIEDSKKAIWYGGCYDECLFQKETSLFAVLDTATMRIVAYNLERFEQIVEVIEQIDLDNP